MAEREANGRFGPGNQMWRRRDAQKGHRPRNEVRAELHAIIDANVSQAAVRRAWQRVEDALLHGGRGWLDLFVLYLNYRYGKPPQALDLNADGELVVRVEYVDTVGDGAPAEASCEPAAGSGGGEAF